MLLRTLYIYLFELTDAAYLQGFIDVDFESEVEDDILPIFRKGEVKFDILTSLFIFIALSI